MTPSQSLLDSAEELLTPGEVARLFRVDPKTVTRWEKDGRLTSLRTLGGHRRYSKTQIAHVLNAGPAGTEVVRALEKVHALALETGATAHAGHIADLITTLHRNG